MKSRTILKYQYDDIGKFLCETYAKKNHLIEKKSEAQKKIADLMAENLPEQLSLHGPFLLQNKIIPETLLMLILKKISIFQA